MAEHEENLSENDEQFEAWLAENDANDSGQESDNDFTIEETADMILGIVKNTPLTKKPSLFCRDCLAPFHGEKTPDGKYILKCTKCENTDVITEDQSTPEDLHLYSGDLIMNKFGAILKEQEDLKKINVNDPNYFDDDYKELHVAYDFFLSLMKDTINSMHGILDDFRQKYNDEMIKRLAMESEELSRIQKKFKQKAADLKVTITGSKETNDLIINPDEYQVPPQVRIRCYQIGKRGIRTADKHFLEKRLYVSFLNEMPYCKARIKGYCSRVGLEPVLLFGDSVKRNECAMKEENVKTKAKKKKRKKKKKSKDESKPIGDDISGKKEASPGALSCTGSIEHTSDKNDSEHSKGAEGHNCSSKENLNKSELKRNSQHHDPLENKRNNTACAKEKPTVVQDKTDEVLGKGGAENDSGKTELDAVHSRNMKLIIDHVMDDFDDITDLAEFAVPYVSKALTELVKTIWKQRNQALEIRRTTAVAHMQQRIAEVTKQVNMVKDEVVGDLQDAYRAKMLKSYRQKKKLDNTEEQMLHYKKLIDHYESTNQLDKLDALVEEIYSYQPGIGN